MWCFDVQRKNLMNCILWMCCMSILHLHRMPFNEKSIQWNVSPTIIWQRLVAQMSPAFGKTDYDVTIKVCVFCAHNTNKPQMSIISDANRHLHSEWRKNCQHYFSLYHRVPTRIVTESFPPVSESPLHRVRGHELDQHLRLLLRRELPHQQRVRLLLATGRTCPGAKTVTNAGGTSNCAPIVAMCHWWKARIRLN